MVMRKQQLLEINLFLTIFMYLSIASMIRKAFFQLIFCFRRKYTIGNFELKIPFGHSLPFNHAIYKLYDRFLPVLAKHVNGQSMIVDIGANVGDTAVSIAQQCHNPITCIEPSDVFFPYLENNNRYKSRSTSQIILVKKLVGTGTISGLLSHRKKITASVKIVQGITMPTHTPLDDLVINIRDIALIKVDTDGYDFDVLKSADQILTFSEPVLFWENEIEEDFQFEGFCDLYSFLESKGYNHVYIFDNFGNLMVEETNFKVLKCINSYIYSMRKYRHTRTIFYTDILATTNKNHSIFKDAIYEFKNMLERGNGWRDSDEDPEEGEREPVEAKPRKPNRPGKLAKTRDHR